ncbi:DUF411 domain-containing protein [Azospira sp. APE16]|jgi:hypothetical protein|uniref:DUF411 domain-containing protein n=1 Tax=Azospira sp. APE16 TaxID=3394231 RepID=UPI000ADC9D03
MRTLVAGLLTALALQSALAAQLPEVTVYKDPDCGCCTEWVKHLQDAGFKVRQIDTRNLPGERERLGVPPTLASCHTAQVGGYLVEGHVPASAVKKLLAEKPAVRGLTIPGMPASAPGMGPHVAGTLKVYTLPKAGEPSRIYSVE